MNKSEPTPRIVPLEVEAIHTRFIRSTRKTAPIEHQIALLEFYLPNMGDEYYPELNVTVSRKTRAQNTLAFLRDVLNGTQQYGSL